jgi:hypothetical protein
MEHPDQPSSCGIMLEKITFNLYADKNAVMSFEYVSVSWCMARVQAI